MGTEYLGATAALPTGTGIRPPCKCNLLPTPIARDGKPNREHASVATVTALQEASKTSVVRITKMKQAESTVDQLSDRPLEGISAHRDHTIIVLVLTWNAHSQIKMGLPPVSPIWNPLIIEQSRETGTLGKVLVARHQVEPIGRSMAVIMSNHTSTAADSQQDIMIKSAETS